MREDLPPTNCAVDELMDAFCDLRDRIVCWGIKGEKDSDLLRRYRYFIQNSNIGRNCTYAIKAKQEFFSTDFKDIMDLIDRIRLLVEKTNNE